MSIELTVRARWFPILYSFFISSGFILCFALSYALHWAKVLRNHCRVWEFVPSVSAVIGDNKPQMNVWRAAIALGSGPRIVYVRTTSY
jgi:hypothetical protein